MKALENRPGLLHPLFFLTMPVIVVLDQLSKAWAWGFVDAHAVGTVHRPAYAVWRPYFFLVKGENTGTIWGLCQDKPALLIPMRFVMVGVLLWFVWTSRRSQRLKLFGLGLVLGGAIGNLLDNLLRESRAVRDFLDFYIPIPFKQNLWDFPAFNLADSMILCGVVALLFAVSKQEQARKSPEPRRKPT